MCIFDNGIKKKCDIISLPFCYIYTLLLHYLLGEKNKLKGKKMKISKTLQKVIKEEGKNSPMAKTIVKLKNSKEFNYLIDTDR